MRRRWRYNLMLLVLALLAWPEPARACQVTVTPHGAPSPTPFTVEARVQSADVIFEGVVVGHEGGNWSGPAIVEVVRYLKGSGPGRVVVYGLGAGLDCLPFAKEGERGLFYARSTLLGELYVDGRENDYTWPRPEVDEVAAIVGHAGAAPKGGGASSALLWLLGACILAGIGVGLWHRRRRGMGGARGEGR